MREWHNYKECVHLGEKRRCEIGMQQNMVSDRTECKQYHGERCECWSREKKNQQLAIQF